ncbi:iron uptake porin [Chroococcus sp. FPU101]|uniref:iron uptake porin n=1 Tax=Chroococcus sp. FPU101 TaxID=1974212 RepID=UPI001A8CB161|nr:iron uptake porin [Chroococcus sp. FPU101]GFE70719.1 probable porin; major outer membrane protein [Chroococcus sp. FPU101]
MFNNLKKALSHQGLVTVTGVLITSPALANELNQTSVNQIQNNKTSSLSQSLYEAQTFSPSTLSNPMSQITNVNQLTDVTPDAWAFEALRSLIERYGCIVGYPDRTFRGNRALSRWEFAAGLNACLNTIERLIQEGVSVLREDIDKLTRLAEEFEAELAALGTRIDNLEQRVAFLEDHQFSTTIKLNGDVIMVASGLWGSEQADAPEGTPLQDNQITFNYRYRANFDTSFTGEDRLQVRLQTSNIVFARGGSNLTDFNFAAPGDNLLQINKLQYRFPVTDQLTAWISGVKVTLDDISDPLAPFTGSFTEGALSYFGAIAPIYVLSDNLGTGLGLLYEFNKSLNLSAFYSAGNGKNPEAGNGLFNGNYVAGSQLTYAPTDKLSLAVAYSRNYIPSGQFDSFSLLGYTGVSNSDNPFNDNATASDNVALLFAWRIIPQISVEGWGMYTRAYAQGGLRDGDTADIWNWKFSLAFPDLFKEGNVGVMTIGQPPYAASISNDNNIADVTEATEDNPWLLETFYVYQINDNISVTPGIYVGINPENNRAPLWVGAIRGSFKF